jgi:hypothetical protein
MILAKGEEITPTELPAEIPVFRAKKNRLLKNLIIAVSICLFTLITSILWDVPYAKAVKFRLVKTFYNIKDNIITVMHKDNKESPTNSNSNDSINKSLSIEQIGELPFHLYVPQYIPKSYKLNNIVWKQYPDNMHVVQQTYSEKDNKTITIIQTENRPEENIETYINPENGTVDVIEINGYDVTLISIDGDMTNAIWYKSDTKFEIIACINKNETINIIKSLE